MDAHFVDKKPQAKKKCAAIVNAVFKVTIKTSFTIDLSSASKSSGEIFAFQIGGTYNVSIAGTVEIATVPLPDIVIGIPKLGQTPTMADVAEYILKGLLDNATSMAEQLINQPGHLGKLVLAMSVTKMSQAALASLFCRGVKKEEVQKRMNKGVKKTQSKLERKRTQLKRLKREIPKVKAPPSAPGFPGYASTVAGMIGAAAAIATIVHGILKLFDDIKKFFGGHSDSDKYEAERQQANNEANAARQTLESSLQISGLTIEVSESSLTASWNPLPSAIPGPGYNVSVDLIFPVLPFEHRQNCTCYSNQLHLTSDDFYMASAVTVSVIPTCTVGTVTFQGPSLSKTISHTATLPPPESVSISVDPKTRALEGQAIGVAFEASSVRFELIGIKPSGGNDVSVSSCNQSGSGNVSYSFLPSVYSQFSGTGFKVQS